MSTRKWSTRDGARDLSALSAPIDESSRPRGATRSRSPSKRRRRSTRYDFDLAALETALETLDVNHDEYEQTASILMAARWSQIRKIKNFLRGEHWVYRSDWVSFWDSDTLGCPGIGRVTAGKVFDVLLDKREQGRVSMADIEKFTKTCQRMWRDLAAKGGKSLEQFRWWEEVRVQREDDEESTRPALEHARSAGSGQSKNDRLEQMIRDLTKARTQYEEEIDRLMSENVQLQRKCQSLEEELHEIKSIPYCNLASHTSKLSLLPRPPTRQRSESQDADDIAANGVALTADQYFNIKREITHVQVEALWLEASSIDVDIDIAASLFDSQKRFMRHVMWGPRADRSYRRGVIVLHEDVRSGGDEGEKMDIFLDQVPCDIQFIVITAAIFRGSSSFQDLEMCDVKVRGTATGVEEQNICHFKLSGTSGRNCNAVVMAMFTRCVNDVVGSDWKFHAVGRNASGTKVAEILPVIEELIAHQ